MRITILFGRKSEIAAVNLHEVIAKFEIGIMLMTDCLNDQFVQDIYDIGQLGGEVANVLIVTDDPSITLGTLDRLQTNFPLIHHVFDAQSLLAPARPFNMPSRFVVEPGGRGSAKRPITLKAYEERALADCRRWEWQDRFDETTRQLVEDEKAGRSIPYISIGYQGTLSERDGQQLFDIESLVEPLPRLGMPGLRFADIERNIERFASENPRLFGMHSMTIQLSAETEADRKAYHDMIRSLCMPAITVPYKADDFDAPPKLPGSFILDEKFAAQFERDDPLTGGLKTISDELRRQHAPMPLGAAANYTTARPTWDKATKQQILADLESIKKTLDSE